MPTSSSRQRAALGGLVALVAVVIGFVFATSHPLRGIVLLIVAALAAGYALVTARR